MNLFLICIVFGLHVLVKDVELLTLTVPKAQEVATLGANQFTLSCTYNTEPGENFLLIELLRKRSGEAESSIVSFTKDANATYGDASLMTRFSSDWPTAGRTANLVFSSIICTDRAEYIWKATYVTTQVKYANLTVNVLVKAITTFNQTAGHITYSPSTNLAEGDEVVFICSGDVGNEPVGRLGWYYYLKSDPLVPVNASSRAQATTPVYQPSTCSFTRSSTLKLVMTKEFNQFLVRCTIQQSKYDQVGEGHRQTSNINVSYAPRIDQLNSVPVKTEGDSVILNCNADANPPPTYYWMLPNYKTSPGSQLQLVYLTVNDIGLYTCVAYNTYKNENHTTNASVRIDVRVKTPPPTKNPEMTTVGTDVELLLILTPTKNPEVATFGSNQFTLSCSYSTDSSDSLVALELYRKRTVESVESKIMVFPATGGNKNASYLDETLKTRTSSDWPNAGNQANLIFSSIACDDKALYMWRAIYLTPQAEVAFANTSISVLVKAITTFNNTAAQITYSPSIDLAEGDEVSFICSGDVGNEPVGHLGWYYYLKTDPTGPVNASSRAVATSPVYQSSTCSYSRSSTLKLVMANEFNQFLVRCTVQQSKYDPFGEGHRQTSNILVSYAPRIDHFSSVPVKTEGDSVTLNCNADANPSPTYYWMLPNSETRPGSQLQLANLTVNHTGVYTCVAYNSYRNENHTTNTSVRIDVGMSTLPPSKNPEITTVGTGVKTPPPTKNPEMTTVGTGNQSESTEQSNYNEQDAKASQSSVTTIVGPIMGSLGAVVLTAVVLFIIYHRRKKLKAQKRGGNSAGVGTPESRRDFNIPENEGTDHTYNTLEGRETEHSYTVIENRGSDRVYMNSHESSETGRSYNTLGSSGTERTYNTLGSSGTERTYNTLGSSGTERTYNTLGSSGTEHPYNTLESSGTEHPYNTLEGYAMNHIYNTLESKGTEHTYSVLKS